jgi:hypothetical protein
MGDKHMRCAIDNDHEGQRAENPYRAARLYEPPEKGRNALHKAAVLLNRCKMVILPRAFAGAWRFPAQDFNLKFAHSCSPVRE